MFNFALSLNCLWSLIFLFLISELFVNLVLNLFNHTHQRLAIRRAHYFKHLQFINQLWWQRLIWFLQYHKEFFDLFLILGLLKLLWKLQELLELALLFVALYLLYLDLPLNSLLNLFLFCKNSIFNLCLDCLWELPCPLFVVCSNRFYLLSCLLESFLTSGFRHGLLLCYCFGWNHSGTHIASISITWLTSIVHSTRIDNMVGWCTTW